ncbi:MAG: tyrosine--tRNA ligase [Planctomycetes bacterium]|nr:tyrosine--tRNA ligase [Planctomycetota bacterium]
MLTPEQQLEVFKRGAVEILPSEEALLEKLRAGRPLRVKLGVDPTATDLHLGHTVPITKLRQVQEIGHQVIFLIGSFTAQIGDPSGQSKTRPTLTFDEVMAHAKTYTDQVWKLLDPAKTEVRYNHEWIEALRPADFVRLLSNMTLARALERDDFQERQKHSENPIHLHELLYSTMQGYDSVALRADVEIGGTDQLFNLLVGRRLQPRYDQTPQIVLTLPLLRGTDGVRKMSKTYGNFIGVTEDARTMFDKVLSLPDDPTLIFEYFQLATNVSVERLAALQLELKAYEKFTRGEPVERTFARGLREIKEELATAVTLLYHPSVDAAGTLTLRPADLAPDGTISIVDLMVKAGLAKSNSEAKNLIRQRGVHFAGTEVVDVQLRVAPRNGDLMRKGRKFVKEVRLAP